MGKFGMEKDSKNENNEEDEEGKGNILKLKYNGSMDYLKNIKGILYYILILFLWIAEENLILIYVDIKRRMIFDIAGNFIIVNIQI